MQRQSPHERKVALDVYVAVPFVVDRQAVPARPVLVQHKPLDHVRLRADQHLAVVPEAIAQVLDVLRRPYPELLRVLRVVVQIQVASVLALCQDQCRRLDEPLHPVRTLNLLLRVPPVAVVRRVRVHDRRKRLQELALHRLEPPDARRRKVDDVEVYLVRLVEPRVRKLQAHHVRLDRVGVSRVEDQVLPYPRPVVVDRRNLQAPLDRRRPVHLRLRKPLKPSLDRRVLQHRERVSRNQRLLPADLARTDLDRLLLVARQEQVQAARHRLPGTHRAANPLVLHMVALRAVKCAARRTRLVVKHPRLRHQTTSQRSGR